MLSIYVILILIEYVSIKYNEWNMETEIKKLKELIETERNIENIDFRQTQSEVQSYNYRSMQ